MLEFFLKNVLRWGLQTPIKLVKFRYLQNMAALLWFNTEMARILCSIKTFEYDLQTPTMLIKFRFILPILV